MLILKNFGQGISLPCFFVNFNLSGYFSFAVANFELSPLKVKSGGMQSQLQAAGQAVASAADGNYGVRVHEASFVAIANVYPADKETAKKNAKENSLLKGLGAAGLPMSK